MADFINVSSYPWPLAEPLWRHGVQSHEDLVTAPTEEPILPQEAQDHLRALNTQDETYIARLIKVARRHIEYRTRRALMPQTWMLVMDRFPLSRGGGWGLSSSLGAGWGSAVIRVPKPPVISIVSLAYIDTDGNQQTLDPSLYQIDLPRGPYAGYGRIRPVPHEHWPDVQYHRFDAVRVTFRCGYIDATSPATSPVQHEVPEDLTQAMLVMMAEMYKTRSESVPGSVSPAMIRARDLWAPYRVY